MLVLLVVPSARKTPTSSAGAGRTTTATAVLDGVARRFCYLLLLFIFLGAPALLQEKTLLFSRATALEISTTTESDVDVRGGGETTTTSTGSNEEDKEQKLPRSHKPTTTAPAAPDEDFFDDEDQDDVLPAGEGKTSMMKTAHGRASSYISHLPSSEDAQLFDVDEESSTTRTPSAINQATSAPAASGRAALEVGAAGARAGGVQPAPRTMDEEGDDEVIFEEPVEDEDAEDVDVASEKPEQEQQEVVLEPELLHQDQPLGKDREEDHALLVENENSNIPPHHRPNLRGSRRTTSGTSSLETTSSSSRAAPTAASRSSMILVRGGQADQVVLQQVDEEKSSFLNSTALSSASALSADEQAGETKSGDEFPLKSSDFVQKTAGSVVKTTSDSSGQNKENNIKEEGQKQLHQEEKEEQQRTTVKVGDLLGCACSAGPPAFSLSEGSLDRQPWARLEPVCKPPAFCPVFGRPYYVPWNAPLSLLDQYLKSASSLKDLLSLLPREDHHEEEPARTGGRSPDDLSPGKTTTATTTWRQRLQAVAEAAHSRIFSTPTVDPHEERLFREVDAQFDEEERLARGLDVDPRLLENPPPKALVRPVTALFDLDEVDSDGRKTGLRGRWSSLTNADPFLLRFTPDLDDVPHSQYGMYRVAQFSEVFREKNDPRGGIHAFISSSSPPAAAAHGPGTRLRDWFLPSASQIQETYASVAEILFVLSGLASADAFATSADRAVFAAPARLHNMCVESCFVYMHEYVNGKDGDKDVGKETLRTLLRVRGALVRYAEDPDSPGAVSKLGFFGDPDAVAEVLRAREFFAGKNSTNEE
ncbi:unnamed protein product [Amoebophrya sp. A120]|nr:unnamed protein product [Amoebophrya sp. A120]|eukprot:GSA120T00020664001.1